ncbi:hypothetical protein BDW02DRAFT_583979 [Decorospora gaudefroyi]|uniref:Uncharacterized protein n=1 Tax=Decorospora gaudefroyi TaxID=184978 RepID=A0A6A5K3B1_9PLEO|nr:hypothetical protein BDW02DRAFT_583979 [Decorospora gaudefroyi]
MFSFSTLFTDTSIVAGVHLFINCRDRCRSIPRPLAKATGSGPDPASPSAKVGVNAGRGVGLSMRPRREGDGGACLPHQRRAAKGNDPLIFPLQAASHKLARMEPSTTLLDKRAVTLLSGSHSTHELQGGRRSDSLGSASRPPQQPRQHVGNGTKLALTHK